MNQTTSKCGKWCYYYFNGQCTKPNKCVSNYYTNRPDENININEIYNQINKNKIADYDAVSFDKSIFSPDTIYIDCQEIYLTKGALEIKIDLTALDFNDISEIIINGIKFKKEQ